MNIVSGCRLKNPTIIDTDDAAAAQLHLQQRAGLKNAEGYALQNTHPHR